MVIPKVGGSAAVTPVRLYPGYTPEAPVPPAPVLSESELKQVIFVWSNGNNNIEIRLLLDSRNVS